MLVELFEEQTNVHGTKRKVLCHFDLRKQFDWQPKPPKDGHAGWQDGLSQANTCEGQRSLLQASNNLGNQLLWHTAGPTLQLKNQTTIGMNLFSKSCGLSVEDMGRLVDHELLNFKMRSWLQFSCLKEKTLVKVWARRKGQAPLKRRFVRPS
jgi:hypothetical protein